MIKIDTKAQLVTGYISMESARVFRALAVATRNAAPALLARHNRR